MPPTWRQQRDLLRVEGKVWRHGGPNAKRLRALEEENGNLKRLLAEAMLDNTALKDLLGRNGDARREANSGRISRKPTR